MKLFQARLGEKGWMMMAVAFFFALIMVLPALFNLINILVASQSDTAHVKMMADGIAQSGVTDAVNWFRRQSIQPVASLADPVAYPWTDAAFYPRASSTTPAGYTIDENIGLVREHMISSSSKFWGRYEVHRQQNPATNPWDPYAAHDVTSSRYPGRQDGEGLAWTLVSFGYIYQRNNPALPFDMAPNRVVARSRYAMDIQTLQLNLPSPAALIVPDLSKVHCPGTGASISSMSGIAVSGQTGSLETACTEGGNWVIGNVVAGGSPWTFQSLMGVDEETFKRMADEREISGSQYTSSNESALNISNRLAGMKLIYSTHSRPSLWNQIGVTVVFGESNPLVEIGVNRYFQSSYEECYPIGGLLVLVGNGIFRFVGNVELTGSVILIGNGSVEFTPYRSTVVTYDESFFAANDIARAMTYRAMGRPWKLEGGALP